MLPPRVVVRCPMENCLYSIMVDDIWYCSGKPWIDMRRPVQFGDGPDCLDYVDGDELREAGVI